MRIFINHFHYQFLFVVFFFLFVFLPIVSEAFFAVPQPPNGRNQKNAGAAAVSDNDAVAVD